MSNFVVIESPYAGKIQENVDYLKKCLLHSMFIENETPFASHLFYTQVLNDEIQEERRIGIQLGYNIGDRADYVVVYEDLGISEGMKNAISRYKNLGKDIVYRRILSE